MPAVGRATTLVCGRYCRTKSRFTVVSSASAMPRLRASATAFRKTSGSTTAEPQFKIHAVLEPRDVRDEVPEIAQAALAERRAGRRRVHVDDVGADRDVDGDRDVEPRGRREDAGARELRLPRGEKLRDRLTDAEAGADAFVDRVVQQPSGLLGHAEAAGAERFVDVL